MISAAGFGDTGLTSWGLRVKEMGLVPGSLAGESISLRVSLKGEDPRLKAQSVSNSRSGNSCPFLAAIIFLACKNKSLI